MALHTMASSSHPRAEGTLVTAPWFVEPVLLQDIVELRGDGQFHRARPQHGHDRSRRQARLARRSHAPPARDRRRARCGGVSAATGCGRNDPSRRRAGRRARPERADRFWIGSLPSVDPAFLPRPLLIVDPLPRNELGKLPREHLLAMLQRRSRESATSPTYARCTRSPAAARAGRRRPPGRWHYVRIRCRSRSAIMGTASDRARRP